MKTDKHTIKIDATGKRPGRLASEIATLLNGKDITTYAPNIAPNVAITIENASKMDISEKKKRGKIYDRYSGYFGGRREETLAQVIKKKGYSEMLRRAIYGMLPNNRLRTVKMKKITIQE